MKVAEAHPHDAFGAVARIDEETMARIGACEGDTLIISGKRRAVARCMPLARIDLSSGINENNGVCNRTVDDIRNTTTCHQ